MWYTKGIVKRNVPEKMQEFFKTNPSKDQLILLDEIDSNNNTIVNMALVVIFGFGMFIGGFIAYYYCYFKTLLGLPF